jgi:predicted component of type VI protein secretion system
MARLQFIADLVADGAGSPGAAVLAWRGSDRTLGQSVIGKELVVGRQTGPGGITVPQDKLLSRRHFVIRAEGSDFVLEDLDSHNGTSINRMRNRVKQSSLRDGDLILAGDQVFAFLDSRNAM